MDLKKLSIRKLIFEFISVSFAVLLALFLNQWREDHNNNKLAEKAIHNIRIELQENKDVMGVLIPLHTSALYQIDSIIAIQEETSSFLDTVPSLKINLISSAAWEMAKITNTFIYLDFDVSNSVTKVYNLQSFYESIVKEFIIKNSVIDQTGADIESLKKVKQFLETIIPLEEDLQKYFNLLLEEVLVE